MKKMVIISLVIGLIVASSVGGGVFFFMKGQQNTLLAEAAKETADESEEEAPPEEGDDSQDEGVIYDLDPFIVNLADTKKVRYLKITIKLDLVREKYSEDLNKHIPQIRDTLLLLLSSKEFSEIRTIEGKMELRDEILQRVNAIFPHNKVKMAYFTDFVSQ